MRTIYEQVQQAVDHIEAHLGSDVTVADAADAAAMSVRSFHQYFPALTGYRFGEYLRKRRLSDAADALVDTDATVLSIALGSGYETHESFTRAFRKEYGIPPQIYRSRKPSGTQFRRIDLVGEVRMGVLTRTLASTDVVYFDGFRPDPEHQAEDQMRTWLAEHADQVGPHRIFGHNIDREGNVSHEPENEGYRVLVTIPHALEVTDASRGEIPGGTFVVTGIEGSFADDPTGSWVMEGWQRMNTMIEQEGIEVPPTPRWFEEWLEPAEPGTTRMDLYLEIA